MNDQIKLDKRILDGHIKLRFPVGNSIGLSSKGAFVVRPDSKQFWAAYPNYEKIPPSNNVEVWKLLGGSLGNEFGPKAANSCAVRISYGLNYGGTLIKKGDWKNYSDKIYEGKAGDDLLYITSAARMLEYFKNTWGNEDCIIRSEQDLTRLENILKEGECALFATSGKFGYGHTGAIKKGYRDPYVIGELPVYVWKLSFS